MQGCPLVYYEIYRILLKNWTINKPCVHITSDDFIMHFIDDFIRFLFYNVSFIKYKDVNSFVLWLSNGTILVLALLVLEHNTLKVYCFEHTYLHILFSKECINGREKIRIRNMIVV